ncbi:Tryptophan--tRNA ligase, mitochondrial [Arthrobotrys conoides]|uniref:tryptophan--tRNA ligase n=1 Tax=Arthrobotrys conoides TaxID=74498 RepID=A0AAN8RYE4_9PEZI
MLPVRICNNASRHAGCKVASLTRRVLPIASKTPFQNPTSCDQPRRLSTSTTPPTHPEVIFSGIQPTGVPHLGNYLGALKQWVDLQNSAPPSTELLYCVVDLHAITQPQDPNDLRRRRQDTMAMLLAVGLKAERCVIFEQSRVAAHSQLMWVLSTLAPTNLLARQTQWKSKLAESEDRSPLDPDGTSKLKLGLFSYPVLQAADILLYGTTLVPVGEDQVQHLELARSLAGKFNRTFGKILVVPRIKLAPAKRVMSLTTPTSKMSKSGAVNSQINLDHSESEIRLRIRGALTDSIPGISYDREARPGVSNMIEMIGNMTNRDDFDVIALECERLSMKEFKDRVADSVVEGLKGIKGEYERIKGEAGYLEEVSKVGAEKANKKANETLGRVMEAMGMGVGSKPSSP